MKATALIAVASVLAILLAGCSQPVDGSGSPAPANPGGDTEVLAKGEIHEEYRRAIDNFPEPMPEGFAYLDALGPEYEPTDGFMEKGAGEVAVAYTWLCAWENSYINSFDSGDTESADGAVAMLAKWKFLPNSAFYMSDPEDSWTKAVLEPAQLGDPSGVRADLSGTCGGFKFDRTK